MSKSVKISVSLPAEVYAYAQAAAAESRGAGRLAEASISGVIAKALALHAASRAGHLPDGQPSSPAATAPGLTAGPCIDLERCLSQIAMDLQAVSALARAAAEREERMVALIAELADTIGEILGREDAHRTASPVPSRRQ